MTGTVEQLLSHMPARTGFDLPYAEVREAQLAALGERFRQAVERIKLVRHRAEEAGITGIRTLEDVVPLLLPHTAYKSYPESFLTSKRWDRLTRWLGTVSSQPVDNIDVSGVEDVDGWIAACEAAGHFVSCTSGTTGKPAMLPASKADLEFAAREGVEAVQWGSAIRAGDKRIVAGFAATAQTSRNAANGGAMIQAFVDFTRIPAPSDAPVITIGSITRMIELRKAIADGTAAPEEIAAFERESATRQAGLDGALDAAVEHIIASRSERLMIMAMWAPLFQLAEKVRARGLSAKDFHPENGVFLGGGLKGARLPENYKEYIYETFNLSPEYIYQMYGMQETQTSMARCSHGRYHIPAWMVCLPLDKEGSSLLPIGDEEITARAAFFDLSLEGRWGGIISGDRIEVDFRPCTCGSPSPSIRDTIARFADLEGDDKIACSGTVDAYVRGVA
ncbi:hypothetical protein [Novosphingobium sp. TH158]|uniref:hypothetical protein n=1 Tax=Novosphingobium sp. TH158 TaxID=2067455 RepID=UPI000C7D7341|nr:hypothetical protein [Novosphingobium sp. TH158]PLK27854.1 hypothetical protein C0V78_07520 [Novosphingobium sp. TH158]